MLFLSVMQNYLLWHYSRAWGEIFHVWFNFLWFTIHFFSIPQLARSWFAPWKRITEDRGDRWSFEDLAGYVIIGLLSRLVGFIIRTLVILIGLIALTLVIVGGAGFFVIWLTLPLSIIVLLVLGLVLLIK
ncbi:hypothetical protein KC851_03145 [Candidatus Kaiserbacteria bacterium]|nr:hypothetical protein [Candidatus Kaiserbacteria bacterium]